MGWGLISTDGLGEACGPCMHEAGRGANAVAVMERDSSTQL